MNSIRPTHLNHFLLKHYKCLRPLQDAQFMELKHSKWEKYIGEDYGKPNAKE